MAPGPGPEGFLLVRDRDVPHADHVGAHRVLRAPDGRRLDYLLGVTGEVGEGLPLVGRPDLARGGTARLLGRGRTWVLVWDEPPPCRQSAIVANGMPQGAFLGLLRGTGLLADR